MMNVLTQTIEFKPGREGDLGLRNIANALSCGWKIIGSPTAIEWSTRDRQGDVSFTTVIAMQVLLMKEV